MFCCVCVILTKMELIENEWFIQAPWGRICIVAWGNCLDPPVLMLHGSGDSLASFRPLLRLLPPNFYYVGFEYPGLGRSDHYPQGSVSLLDFAHCIEIVRRHHRWDRFILLAHSMGATTGRLYNLAHPGRIVRAIELDQLSMSVVLPLEKWYKIYYEDKYKTIENKDENKIQKYTWDQAIEKVIKNRPELTPELARATLERWSEPAGEGQIRFTYDPRWKRFVRPPFSHDQIKTLFTSLSTPTLGIYSENSIEKNLNRNMPFLLEEYGNYRVRKVKGDHDVHITHPERVAPFVSQFLMNGLEGLDRKAKL